MGVGGGGGGGGGGEGGGYQCYRQLLQIVLGSENNSYTGELHLHL